MRPIPSPRHRARPALAGSLAAVLAVAGLAVPRAAQAQLDYRNLDQHSPSAVTDAYPVERYAFELAAPFRTSWLRDDVQVSSVDAELLYGLARNLQVGLLAPLAQSRRGRYSTLALAGIQVAALYNFTNETEALPGLSLRGEAALPVGGFGGEGVRYGLTGLATRSFGLTRLHLNVSGSAGAETGGLEEATLPRWSAGLAVDRTLLRRSVLLVADLYAQRPVAEAAVEVTAGVGTRVQVSPALVLSGGLGRRMSRSGSNFTLSLGVSRTFAIAGLMPIPSPDGAP